MNEWSQQILSLYEKKTSFVSITLVHVIGSAPQVSGAKALITNKGLHFGTVGGGRVEAKAILHAQDLLKKAPAQLCDFVQWNLSKDVGMTCGGVVSFFFEVHTQNEWPIAVFGAGHVSQELIPLLTRLQCQITCIDDRQEWLQRITPAANLTLIHSTNAKSLVQSFPEQTYFVLMTQGHRSDLPVLAEILRTQKPPFVGVIGSKTKGTVLRAELKKLEFTPEQIHFHCPIGLPIGNNSIPEICFSIVAQLLQTRDRLQAGVNPQADHELQPDEDPHGPTNL